MNILPIKCQVSNTIKSQNKTNTTETLSKQDNRNVSFYGFHNTITTKINVHNEASEELLKQIKEAINFAKTNKVGMHSYNSKYNTQHVRLITNYENSTNSYNLNLRFVNDNNPNNPTTMLATINQYGKMVCAKLANKDNQLMFSRYGKDDYRKMFLTHNGCEYAYHQLGTYEQNWYAQGQTKLEKNNNIDELEKILHSMIGDCSDLFIEMTQTRRSVFK